MTSRSVRQHSLGMAKAVDERLGAEKGGRRDPREEREARLAKALRDNLRRRKVGVGAPEAEDDSSGR